jgi:hypothetical protein
MAGSTVKTAPAILHLEWGRVEVEDEAAFKDVKIFPGGARAWDWNETGTRHDPGVQTADLEELLEHGAQWVLLTRGFHDRLQIPSETLAWLEEQGISVTVVNSGEALEQFNARRKAIPSGALIHSTC